MRRWMDQFVLSRLPDEHGISKFSNSNENFADVRLVDAFRALHPDQPKAFTVQVSHSLLAMYVLTLWGVVLEYGDSGACNQFWHPT